jgi:serine phosphatase RsbU (regulator of sigma subunit)
MDHPGVDYAAVFAATPTASLLLSPDRFMILDANAAYERAVGMPRDAVVGRPLFDAFPASPHAASHERAQWVRDSLERVLRTGEPDALPPHRYDVRDVTNGEFAERYWSIVTVPIPGADGRIAALLQKVEDLTPFMAGPGTSEPGAPGATREPDPFAVDVLVRARELREAFLRMRDVAERDRQVALVLQESFLTPPAHTDDLTVAVRYRAAAAGTAVGGDWYDAFVQPGGSTVLAVGDVTGHDPAAAAQMGQLRALIRAIAYDSGSCPAQTLERADRAARGLALETTATAVVVRIEPADPSDPRAAAGSDAQAAPAGRVVGWSSAGHLPPVVLRADGAVELLGSPSEPMLGVVPEWSRTEHRLTLADGDTLLLYTDGLVERREEDIDDSLALLVSTVDGLHADSLDDLCDAVLDRMAARDHDDDVVLLAVRPVPGPAGAGGDTGAATDAAAPVG